ncbi:MAG: radical SAM protein [Candidatus Lokiarchaeota archaeon]|nr:radical SAM protein [Candidatus Lokiarchaeota archaeon]
MGLIDKISKKIEEHNIQLKNVNIILFITGLILIILSMFLTIGAMLTNFIHYSTQLNAYSLIISLIIIGSSLLIAFFIFAIYLARPPRKPEVIHAQILDDEFQGKKLHLSIDQKGMGTLTVDASRILYLNKEATDFMKLQIAKNDEKYIIENMLKKYHLTEKTAREDFKKLKETIISLTEMADVCPITYLEVETTKPFSKITRPMRVDLALTYKCNNECDHCYVGRSKDIKELTTNQWKQIISKLYEIGVPHVTFTGGEATLREDLIDLIKYCEETGVVCGLVTNGRKLKDNDYVKKLVDAGLDYFQITLESHDSKIHDKMVGVNGAWNDTIEGIKNAIATPIYTLTNTTITTLNAAEIDKTIDFLGSLESDSQHLEQFAMNSLIYSGKAVKVGSELGINEENIGDIIDIIKAKAEENNMRFIWYTPTEYCVFNPLHHGLGVKRCSAASISICIEPNGDVIPCQSYYKSVGNLLKEEWNKIWYSKLFKNIRDRKYVQDKCKGCSELEVCGGGCPLYAENKNIICGNVGSSP